MSRDAPGLGGLLVLEGNLGVTARALLNGLHEPVYRPPPKDLLLIEAGLCPIGVKVGDLVRGILD